MKKIKIVVQAIRNGERVSLTKMFLMAAPAGSYLVSNIGGLEPIFAEIVESSMAGKLAQWEKIVSVGANHRLCCLYRC